MSEIKPISIRVHLEGELLNKFEKVQQNLGIKNQTEVLRFLISKYAREQNL